ncbi:MAG: hypothetical protein JXR42_00245 [Gammaproteobacteria bacterium]|nr:hypothetical protein [Gammaproteobacteria bacterium]
MRGSSLKRKNINWKDYKHCCLNLLHKRSFLINAIIGGLFYLPTSIFAVLWGVSFLRMQDSLPATQASLAITLLFLGWAIGSPIIGFFCGHFKFKRIVLIGAATLAMLLSICLLYTHQIADMVYFILFTLGLLSSFQVIVWDRLAASTETDNTGIAIALTNMIIMIIPVFFHLIVGALMDLHHTMIHEKLKHFYSLADYHFALIVIPLAFFSVVILQL